MAELESHLQNRLIGRVREFRVVVAGAGLILRGHAHSYYAKQLAQHAVMGASRLPILANEIEVS
jgi:hypothetical protein